MILVVGVAASGILILSAYSLWHGGHCIGYRHIIPGAMLLALSSAFLFEQVKGRWKMVLIQILPFSRFTGVAAFIIQLTPLFEITSKAEPLDVHANSYIEVLLPLLMGNAG